MMFGNRVIAEYVIVTGLTVYRSRDSLLIGLHLLSLRDLSQNFA